MNTRESPSIRVGVVRDVNEVHTPIALQIANLYTSERFIKKQCGQSSRIVE